MKQQQRFIVALVVSAAVLILWNYAFPPVKPPQPNANANANANVSAPPATTSSPQPTSQPTTSAKRAQTAHSPAPTAEPNPQRKLRIVTPLYEATLDTHGAVATSWIITRNKNTGREIYAASSTKSNHKPLELVPAPPDGVAPDQLFRPLQIVSGDATVDALLAGRNFKVSGPKAESGDETIDVPSGSHQIDFVIHDDATGLDATKRVTFFADRYSAEVELKILRNNQPLPQVKLAIGPSIGDQGIEHHTFYTVAPEGVAVADGKAERFPAEPIHRNAGGWFSSPRPGGADLQKVGGNVSWGGGGATYLWMIVVPA